jgi:hypothetical protein
LDIGVKRDQSETDNDGDHKPADIFRYFGILIHKKLFGVDLRHANFIRAI